MIALSRGMKLLLIAALGFLVISCAQKEGGPTTDRSLPAATTTTVVHGSMTASVNGEQWTASGTPSEKSLDNVVGMLDPKGLLTITGHAYQNHAVAADADDAIEIAVKTIAPGTYSLGPDFDHLQTATYTKGTDTSEVYFIHAGQSGEVTITRVDTAVHRIFGTFHFDARNTKGKDIHVTNGAFDNVGYQ